MEPSARPERLRSPAPNPGKTGLTQGPGKLGKTGLTTGPGKLGKTGKTGKTSLTQGPGKLGKAGLTQGKLGKTGKTVTMGKTGKLGKVARVDRNRRNIFVNNRWRALVPLVALGAFVVGAETFYADSYVPVEEPVCTGYAEDGSLMRWVVVPTEDGGTENQCVAYSPQRNRTITEIVVPEEPMAEAPPPVQRETVGVGPASEPTVTPPAPPAPATGCELLIYSEANFKGLSAPVDDSQSSLSEDGWQNEIASMQIKSGTWDFYSDEDYAGDRRSTPRGASTSVRSCVQPPASEERTLVPGSLALFPSPARAGGFAFAVL